jgi:hypothetical protein
MTGTRSSVAALLAKAVEAGAPPPPPPPPKAATATKAPTSRKAAAKGGKAAAKGGKAAAKAKATKAPAKNNRAAKNNIASKTTIIINDIQEVGRDTTADDVSLELLKIVFNRHKNLLVSQNEVMKSHKQDHRLGQSGFQRIRTRKAKATYLQSPVPCFYPGCQKIFLMKQAAFATLPKLDDGTVDGSQKWIDADNFKSICAMHFKEKHVGFSFLAISNRKGCKALTDIHGEGVVLPEPDNVEYER